jgi:periplasmic protein TonB
VKPRAAAAVLLLHGVLAGVLVGVIWPGQALRPAPGEAQVQVVPVWLRTPQNPCATGHSLPLPRAGEGRGEGLCAATALPKPTPKPTPTPTPSPQPSPAPREREPNPLPRSSALSSPSGEHTDLAESASALPQVHTDRVHTVRAEPVQAPATAAPTAVVTASPPEPLRHAATHRDCARAPYPAALRERGIEGQLRLRVQVTPEGSAAQVLLLASSGFRLFDEAALAQARGCRFTPARLGDEAVADWVEFAVRFSLDG